MGSRSQPTCRSCGAPVIWAQAENGSNVMLDKARDVSETSRHVVMRDVQLQLHVRVLPQGAEPRPGIEHRHQPHYATCPERRKGPGDD